MCGSLRCEWMLDGQSQIVATPVLGSWPQHELSESSPSIGQIVERTEDAKHGISLSVTSCIYLRIAEGTDRKVLRSTQDEGAGSHLLIGTDTSRVKAGIADGVQPTKVSLRIGNR